MHYYLIAAGILILAVSVVLAVVDAIATVHLGRSISRSVREKNADQIATLFGIPYDVPHFTIRPIR